jgi:adenylate cyclase
MDVLSWSSKPLALLRAEVVGRGRIFERVGSAEATHAVVRCNKRVDRAIAGQRGVQLSAGESIVATFTTADEACAAAIEIQERVADLPPVSGVKLSIRIALYCGDLACQEGALEGPVAGIAGQLLAISMPGQIITSGDVATRLSHVFVVRDLDQLEVIGDGEACRIFEILWQQVPASGGDAVPSEHLLAATAVVTPADGGLAHFAASDEVLHERPENRPRKFCLRYQGRSYLLDAVRPLLTLGRDQGNDVVIWDRKASRGHARIELQNDGVFLRDASTNGTYVTFGEEPEVFVRSESVALHGSGYMCFGNSANDPQHAERAEFEYI